MSVSPGLVRLQGKRVALSGWAFSETPGHLRLEQPIQQDCFHAAPKANFAVDRDDRDLIAKPRGQDRIVIHILALEHEFIDSLRFLQFCPGVVTKVTTPACVHQKTKVSESIGGVPPLPEPQSCKNLA